MGLIIGFLKPFGISLRRNAKQEFGDVATEHNRLLLEKCIKWLVERNHSG